MNNLQSINIVRPRDENEIAKFPNDFESRLEQQKLLNARDLKLLEKHAKVTRHLNIFRKSLNFLNLRPRKTKDISKYLSKSGLPRKKTISLIKQENIGLNVNSLGRLEWRSSRFGIREKIIVSSTPTMSEPNRVPTFLMFTADPVTCNWSHPRY